FLFLTVNSIPWTETYRLPMVYGVLNVGRVLLRVCFLQLKGLGLSSTSRIVRGLFGLAEMHLVGEASLFTSRQ
ncbi:hypothetical protein D0Y65_011880, partial [Glycine soja]